MVPEGHFRKRSPGSHARSADLETVAKLSVTLVDAMLNRLRLRAAQQKNTLLERRLLERKLIEPAKGLLQLQQNCTEEEAYYQIRRTSRHLRTPMSLIAQRIIDTATAKEAEQVA